MSSRKKVYLFGGGGHAKVVMDVFRSQFGENCISGIFDDDLTKKGTDFYKSKILGKIESNTSLLSNLLIAIGNNQIRKDKSIDLKNNTNSYITGIHSSAVISTSAIIGDGTIIMAGVTINADCIIKEHCIINTNSTIEHDCIIEDFVHVAPGTILTGGVKVGELSFIGANSTILPGVVIGENCIVGAGSVVRKNIPNNSMVYGNPSKIVRNRKINE